MPARKTHIAVVGAGVAGLVAAIELAGRGHAVTLLERAATPGGKLRLVRAGAASIDAGPTVLTMRGIFDDIFRAAGTTLNAHLQLRPLQVLARHAWSERERLDLYADTARSADAIGEFAGAAAARGYLRFCADARAVFRTLERPFLQQPRPGLAGLLRSAGLRGLPRLLQLRPFTSLWRALGDYFPDPRLRQLFGRYATYCGSSPWQAPATLMLVAHVEQAGVWRIEGGMHALALALESVARARGVTLRYASAVRRIRLHAGRVAQLELGSGERLPVDAALLTSDAAALAAGVYGSEVGAASAPLAPRERSLSAMTWNVYGRAGDFPLLRHNVFFSTDYAAEFDALFTRRQLPAAPTVYVCAQDRADTPLPEPGAAERLLCLVNAPADGDTHRYTDKEIFQCLNTTLATLRRCGLELRAEPTHLVATTPTDFNALFPGSGGALYGQATHGWRASFRRPGVRTPLAGLYLAGGSTHPGPGLPMAALSARHAARCLLQDLASTPPSRTAATRGGTSTR